MFGYQESKYTVIKEHQLNLKNDIIQFIEHRFVKQNHGSFFKQNEKNYIAIFNKNSQNQTTFDVLVFFDNNTILEEEFAKIITTPDLKIKELNYKECIYYHGTGYTSDGTIIMY
jgi:hypothetical protein